MANKVIKISNTTTATSESGGKLNEVYRDVLMESPNNTSKIGVEDLPTSKYAIGKLVDVNAVKNSVHNIFTWIPGERILNPEFGSNLRKLLYEGITQFNIERIGAEIRNSMSIWEPRVNILRIVNIENVDNTEDNTVHLEIEYTIKGLSSDEVYSESVIYNKLD